MGAQKTQVKMQQTRKIDMDSCNKRVYNGNNSAKEVKTVSEKQKALAEKIAALPEKLQDKFTDKVDGAIMALDLMAEAQADAEKEGNKSG